MTAWSSLSQTLFPGEEWFHWFYNYLRFIEKRYQINCYDPSWHYRSTSDTTSQVIEHGSSDNACQFKPCDRMIIWFHMYIATATSCKCIWHEYRLTEHSTKFILLLNFSPLDLIKLGASFCFFFFPDYRLLVFLPFHHRIVMQRSKVHESSKQGL